MRLHAAKVTNAPHTQGNFFPGTLTKALTVLFSFQN
jgi:hypothetical protein